MNKLSLVLAMATAIALAPSAAKADSFNYTYTGNDGIVATGLLTGDLTAPDTYTLTSGTIWITGAPDCTTCGSSPVSLNGGGVLENVGVVLNVGGGTDLFGQDNLFFPDANPELDPNGLVFQLDSGSGVNLWGNGVDNYAMFGGSWTFWDSGSFESSAAPEPSSLLLLGTGLLGLAGMARRRLSL